MIRFCGEPPSMSSHVTPPATHGDSAHAVRSRGRAHLVYWRSGRPPSPGRPRHRWGRVGRFLMVALFNPSWCPAPFPILAPPCDPPGGHEPTLGARCAMARASRVAPLW